MAAIPRRIPNASPAFAPPLISLDCVDFSGVAVADEIDGTVLAAGAKPSVTVEEEDGTKVERIVDEERAVALVIAANEELGLCG
jgi:hypothetical protein